MALHVSRAVGHDGVADGVGLVEGVAGKVQDLVIDAVGHVLADAPCQGAGDVPGRIAMDKGHPLRVNDLMLFLAHGTADHIRLTQGEARQLAENLDHLLLIHDAAVGDGEDGT